MTTHNDEMRDPGGFNIDAHIAASAREFASRVALHNPTIRMDTATAMFASQLEYIYSETYDQPYPGLMAKSFMSMATNIPAGAETVTQRGYDITGRATILAGEATDVMRVSLRGSEEHTRIVGTAVKWAITLQQLAAAAMAGVPLDSSGLQASKLIVERENDSLLSLGDATLGIIGMCSQVTKVWAAAGAGVNLAAVGAPVGFTAAWQNPATTAAQILADIAILVGFFRAGNIFEPTNMACGSTTYARLENEQAIVGSEKSILELVQSRYKGLTINPWWRLDTAGAGGGERVMLYAKNKMVCEGIVSLEPTFYPPYYTGLGYETTTYSRCGGIKAANTTGIVYADM